MATCTHPYNPALSGGFDYIAGRSLKPRAPVFYAGTDVRVGYSAVGAEVQADFIRIVYPGVCY